MAAVHPGYGFLSESPEFVAAVEAAGMVWLGPRASTMDDFALKHVAKERALAADVPVLSGSPVVSSAPGTFLKLSAAETGLMLLWWHNHSVQNRLNQANKDKSISEVLPFTDAVAAAEAVGYPVLLKASGGGGGMGIYTCSSSEEVQRNFPLAVSQGEKSFGNGDVFVEKYIQRAKHIEVQVRSTFMIYGKTQPYVKQAHNTCRTPAALTKDLAL